MSRQEMNHNPYTTPKAAKSLYIKTDIPEEIIKKIRNGWIAGIFNGVLILGILLLTLNTNELTEFTDYWIFADVVIVFSLILGTYLKSRFATTAMVVYLIASKIFIFIEIGKTGSLIMWLFFLYFYFQAMVGTYQYHKIINQT